MIELVEKGISKRLPGLVSIKLQGGVQGCCMQTVSKKGNSRILVASINSSVVRTEQHRLNCYRYSEGLLVATPEKGVF